MALIIEDGSLVDGANSYCSVAYARSYAAARGKEFPSTTNEAEVLLIQAADYLESYRARFKGSKVAKSQSLQWPRSGVTEVDGFDVAEDEIPDLLMRAQAQLAIDCQGQELQPNSDGRAVVSEEIAGVIKTDYASNVSGAPRPVFAAAEAMLAPLLSTDAFASAAALRVVRV